MLSLLGFTLNSRWLVVIFPLLSSAEAITSYLTEVFNRSDKELTLETSAFKLFTVANLRYQLS